MGKSFVLSFPTYLQTWFTVFLSLQVHHNTKKWTKNTAALLKYVMKATRVTETPAKPSPLGQSGYGPDLHMCFCSFAAALRMWCLPNHSTIVNIEYCINLHWSRTNHQLLSFLRSSSFYFHVRRTNRSIRIPSKIRSWAVSTFPDSTNTETSEKLVFNLTCVSAKKFVCGYLKNKLTDLNENFGVCCN